MRDAAGHIVSAINSLQKVKEAAGNEALKSDVQWLQDMLLGLGRELTILSRNVSAK